MSDYNYIKKAEKIFEKTGADALLLLDESNMHYFCGFSPSEGAVIITKDGAAYHLVDSRYTLAALEYAKESSLKVIEINTTFSAEAGAICKKHAVSALAFEDETISFKSYNEYKEAAGCKLIGIGRLLSEIRNVKTPDEIEKIKQANAIAERSFIELLNCVAPGKTEKELAAQFDYIMAKNGSDGVSFSTILLCGSHTSLPHGVPSGRSVQKGDFVLFDFGATYKGYHSDMTRTVAVGSADEEMKECYSLVLAAQFTGISALKAGAPCCEVYKAAYDVLEGQRMGKYFRHSLGHGIGLDIHEGYNVSPKSKDIFAAGNITSIEPGIYLPDKFGIRIEDMCLVTENGCEIISQVSKDLTVV
ncbi:MAG: Xaa-Pro peptidase family protein [Clostridiales bacterium]|nr:Xaa-Pro peptidase family protein [Clostridiales bacterium]